MSRIIGAGFQRVVERLLDEEADMLAELESFLKVSVNFAWKASTQTIRCCPAVT